MSEQVRQIDINDEMRESYLNYAMSVIVSRALPDARDGMKPVQRRILYAMHDMGLRPDRPFKKSARVVGEVLGKYHPHGDQAVYDAMVRMAQDFSLRYELVDGQGNFGSIDGDGAAAMRYTETRMTNVGADMLIDLDKDTVDFTYNFDDSLQEPSVLPATVPSLLVNGSAGIAVGMSTSIPPHNLGEVIDALTYMLDNWNKLDDVGVLELMKFIPGPDFPTGGVVFRYRGDTDMLTKSYASGRGRVTVRATATIEQIGRNKSRIIVTELPYQVNKTNLMSKIADLHRDGKLEGLTDLRDESDRNGMRIIIETTRNVDAEEVLLQLYKYTPMEQTFSIIMLALVNGEPKVLTLKQALKVYLDHRLEVVRRRSQYELERARRRAHIVEGLLIALDNLDDVISTIRRSRRVETAHANLVKKFKLTDEQATAILNMQLRRLAALERRKLQDEYKTLRATIESLEGLLASGVKMRKIVRAELLEVKEKYADARRTVIVDDAKSSVVTATDLVENERVWVVVGEEGMVGRTAGEKLFDIPKKPKELPYLLLEANTKDILYLVAANGEAVSRYVYELPEVRGIGEGVHWTEGTGFARAAHLAAAVAIPEAMVGAEAGYLFLTTVGGTVKRVRVEDLPPVGDQSFTMMRVDDGDALGWARWTSGKHEILLATTHGQLIRFDEEDVRPMTLRAGGVSGIKLKDETDGVVGMEVITPQAAENKKDVALVWSITDNGLAKATKVSIYPKQKRYGQGVVNVKLPRDSEEVVAMLVGDSRTEIYINKKRNSVKRSKLGKVDIGRRNLTPKEVPGLRLGKTDRVTGAVRGSRAVEERAAEQLSLI